MTFHFCLVSSIAKSQDVTFKLVAHKVNVRDIYIFFLLAPYSVYMLVLVIL